jgi:serine/threonine-protein kinase
VTATLRDRYCVLEATATTAAAIVYAAEDVHDQRPVMLTILRGEAAADAEFVTAVREQLHRLTRGGFEHPALVTLLDSGTTDAGELFIVHEAAAGRSLREVLDERGPLGLDAGLRIAIQVGEALEMLHRGGVVHGELRPDCVVLLGETLTTVKLLGVELASAHQTATGRRLRAASVAPYLAPEQQDGHETTEAADIHALGLLVRELITGQRPPGAPAGAGVPASLPPAVARIVAKALQRPPARRYANVSLMVNDLWTVESEPAASAARPASVAAERRASSTRRAGSDAGMVTALVGGLLLLVVTGWVVTSDRFVGTLRLESPESPVAASPSAPPPPAPAPPRDEPVVAAPVLPAPAPPAVDVPSPVLPPRAAGMVSPAAAPPPSAALTPALPPKASPAVTPPPPPKASAAAAPPPPPKPSAAPARRPVGTARAEQPVAPAAADEGSDGVAIIDWLLKERRRD